MIAIIDYGMGNLASVEKAVKFLGGKVRVTSDPRKITRASGIILPGVGAFGAAMREMKKRRLIGPVSAAAREGKPFLGLCLGLQLLFESSEESPGVKGLGLLKGKVRLLPKRPGLKIPHMGWNNIKPVVERGARGGGNPNRQTRNPLLIGIPDGAFVYFVHSYYADPKEKSVVAAVTEYGVKFPSVVWNGEKLWATQFHPEKSQKVGLKILDNFLRQAC